MPTPIETTIDIVLDPSSRMRDISPLVYQLPKDPSAQSFPAVDNIPVGVTRMIH